MRTGSFQLMKSMNRSIILNLIREKGPISRAEIAKITKLTPPTVSNIVKELLRSEFVIETSQGTSKGGRKPTLLDINSNHFFIIGIDVGHVYVKFVTSNLAGDVLEQVRLKLDSHPNKQTMINVLKRGVHKLLEQSQLHVDRCLGIGVGMHGIVDNENGISLFTPAFNLRDIPVASVLEDEFQLMVKVENDVRAMTLGEAWFGNGDKQENFVGVNVGYGIGAGIMYEGQLFHGEANIAGEIGHMTIDLNGPKCDCGNYGCLQAIAAGPAIAERAVKELKFGASSLLTDMCGGDLDKVTGSMVHKAAVQGDEFSTRILHDTGRYLGIGLTNLIHTVNPTRIIIGGGVAQAGEFILSGVQEMIASKGLTQQAKETPVLSARLKENSTVMGAVVLILQEFFVRK
ncbi:ROK family transcriptional regulator [Pontibacillus halophilus JSM 076056 = DSM 19796]|uniref:ROK family transcriptional regulator n=2 Tax=Pontibacillus TaxID=289201 RepID=A0A0A5IDQ1_9BACI|nr:ROK family transcriptional regulator [Pontibacillus halophilus JSM 076056 = DSM 19796]